MTRWEPLGESALDSCSVDGTRAGMYCNVTPEVDLHVQRGSGSYHVAAPHHGKGSSQIAGHCLPGRSGGSGIGHKADAGAAQ
jgi:hypothetical protein